MNRQKKAAGPAIVQDPHSYASPADIVVTHMSINLSLDFASRQMSGFVTLSVDNKTGTNLLVLDSRDLTVSRVLLDDSSEAAFQFGKASAVLGAPLEINVKPKTRSVTVYYNTSPDATAVQWVSLHKRDPFLFTQSQAILARSWVPCQDSPGIRFTYDAHIRVPANLMALMSAGNDTVKHADGNYSFRMDQPISSYLLALTVGNFEYHTLGKNCGVYAEPDMIAKAAWEFADLPKMILAAEELYGPYRWEKYDVVVLPPSFPFGGMENPRLTFATPTIIAGDRSLVALLAHELAHSWSGNLVTNATWNDFWLNEGFTVYFENRIMEKVYGKEYSDMLEFLGYHDLMKTVAELGANSPNTHLLLDMKSTDDPDEAVNDIAYEKGRFFLRTIEDAVGRESWDRFLRTYFDKHAFTATDTKSFLAYLDKNLVKDDAVLKSKINADAWVYGPGIPSNCPKVKSALFDRVDEQVSKWRNGTEATRLVTQGWNTHQWLRFLRTIPDTMSLLQMKSLDDAFHFTASGNAEILCDWYQLCIVNKYAPARKNIENFMLTVGRRKFLEPLYSKMSMTPDGLTEARTIFGKARPGYHPLTTHTIGQIVKQ